MYVKIRRLVPLGIRASWFRFKRFLNNYKNRAVFARVHLRDFSDYQHKLFSHRALLFRDYPEPWYSLQKNKVHNLKIASAKLNGLVIRPGEVFSFWHVIGSTGWLKGYKKGMTYVGSRITPSTGGGLCQLSNALYWAALNTGLKIVERHRHSLDPFPDSHRSVPFACGATVFYNYLDLRFENTLAVPLAIETRLDDKYLHVELYSNNDMRTKYRIEERNHRFVKTKRGLVRKNEIWRIIREYDGSAREELIAKNEGLVLYDVDPSLVEEIR